MTPTPIERHTYTVAVKLAEQDPMAILAIPVHLRRAGFLQEVTAPSREVAQQVAIDLTFRIPWREFTPPENAAALPFEVLTVEAPCPEWGRAASFLTTHKDKWERVQWKPSEERFWIGNAPRELPERLTESLVVVSASHFRDALEMAVGESLHFYERSFPLYKWPDGVKEIEVLCVPTIACNKAPEKGRGLGDWIQDYDHLPADAWRTTVNVRAFQAAVIRSRTAKTFAGILPSDFPDPIERLHYRHVALRDEVLHMCDRMAAQVIALEIRNGEITVDENWLYRRDRFLSFPAPAEPTWFIDSPNGWYSYRRADFKKWDITRQDVRDTYHRLRPLDLLRYCCRELDENDLETWSQRFPWVPATLDHLVTCDYFVNGGWELESDHALRPWFTIHSKLWADYVADCQAWAIAKNYGQPSAHATALPTTYLEERPWLRQEFSVNVGAATSRLPTGRAKVEGILRAGIPPHLHLPAVPAQDLYTSSTTWARACTAAGITPQPDTPQRPHAAIER